MVVLLALPARAQSASPASPASPASARVLTDGSRPPGEAAAQEHFQRALLWYRTGKYRLAFDDLAAALERDPGGKDLVFNLALVQEKLGDLDGAIRSLQRFQNMETDPAEIERAAQTMRRLEGAHAELALHERGVAAPSAPPVVNRTRGKLDGWVAGTGALAVASLVIGAIFAVRALSLAPQSGGTSAQVKRRAERAHDAALVSDIALSASVLTGAGAAALYFGRYVDAPQHAVAPLHLPAVAAAWFELRY